MVVDSPEPVAPTSSSKPRFSMIKVGEHGRQSEVAQLRNNRRHKAEHRRNGAALTKRR